MGRRQLRWRESSRIKISVQREGIRGKKCHLPEGSARGALLASDRGAETPGRRDQASVSTLRNQSIGVNLCDARQAAPAEAGRLSESGKRPNNSGLRLSQTSDFILQTSYAS